MRCPGGYGAGPNRGRLEVGAFRTFGFSRALAGPHHAPLAPTVRLATHDGSINSRALSRWASSADARRSGRRTKRVVRPAATASLASKRTRTWGHGRAGCDLQG